MIGVVAFVATIFAFATLPMTFQPPLNLDFSQVQIEMPPGSTLERTNVVANKVVRLLRSKPEVEDAFADVSPTSAELFVTLKKDRERTSVEFERAYSPELQAIADARINFQSQAGNQSGRDLNLTLVGDDPAKIEQAAEKIIAEMRRLPEIRAPRINGELQRPEITIKPRLDLAADLGVTTAALSQTIRIATLGDIDQNSAKFSLSDRQVPIRVALPQTSRRNLDDHREPAGADRERRLGAAEARRRDQLRRRPERGQALQPAPADLDRRRPRARHRHQRRDEEDRGAAGGARTCPDGVEKVEVGAAKWQAELVSNFILAVVAGVFLVFAVLVLLYKRVLPPFVNMGSLLLAPLGGAIALHLTGNPMSLPVMIGLLMLLGIVAKNSILLIDFAIEEIGKGVPKDEAIVDAGHKRAQPIVMTTVAMVAGMLPIALSFTGDGSWRAPMGVVVIGGLILSTVLTLVIVPAGFSLADSFEQWLGRRLRPDPHLPARRTTPSGRRRSRPSEPSPPAGIGGPWSPLKRPGTASGQMRIIATGMLVAMAGVFLAANRLGRDLARARLRQGLRRGGDGRRPRRLVRGHRPVPPPARPAHPAHRDHPAQQGPDRRRARRLPSRELPDPDGRRAADAQRRHRRSDRPLPRQPAARGAPARRAARG